VFVVMEMVSHVSLAVGATRQNLACAGGRRNGGLNMANVHLHDAHGADLR
jgi:hypothetical protein